MENKDNIECRFCWEEIKSAAKKCKHCGEFLDDSNNQKQPTINIVNQQTMNNNDNWVVEKSWIVALLLAIFFWWAWFDRFYLWHWGSWIIKFFTGGLLGIWWIIDIFLILTKWIPWIKWK